MKSFLRGTFGPVVAIVLQGAYAACSQPNLEENHDVQACQLAHGDRACRFALTSPITVVSAMTEATVNVGGAPMQCHGLVM